MLSLDVLLVSSLLAMPLAPVRQEPPPPPEPPAQPEPAPEPEPDPEPAPEPEPNIDEPPSEPGETPSEREIELEEQLAEARARAADLERMIEVLRQQLAEARAKAADLEPMINALQQQVAQLRAELEDQKLARESRSESQTPAALEAPSPTVQTIADPAGHSPQDPAAPEPSVAASAGPPADAPSAIRSWDEDPDDARPAPSAPARAPTPAPPADSAEALVTSIRGAYAARFPSVPSPAQRDAFDAFTADVVKWSAAQQRSLRRPVIWTVQFLRVEKGSGKDRMVRFIARSAVRTGPQGAGGTFVVRVPRAEAERLLKGDYRSGSFEVSGTLTPVVRFAPERPYDGISSTPSAFVGPYCEVSVALDTQSISPGS